MSTHYDIQTESRLITQTYRDSISLFDIKELEKVILADPRYDVEYDVIIDLLEATLTTTTADVQTLCNFIAGSTLRSHGRTSIVVDSFLETALSMIFRAHVIPTLSIGIFTTYDAAYRYLGRDLASSGTHQL